MDDNCLLTTNTNLGNGNLTTTGSGTFAIAANLTVRSYKPQCTSCVMSISAGNKIAIG